MSKNKKRPQKKSISKGGGDKKHPSVYDKVEEQVQRELEGIAGVENISKSKDGTVVIDVSAQQMDKIMHPPTEFKKASEIDPEIERLKFDNGKLRTRLAVFDIYIEHDKNLYLLQVDPLNRMVKILEEEPSTVEARLKAGLTTT